MEVRRIKKEITHQNIGGKEFIVDEGITRGLTNDNVIIAGTLEGNWACRNFINRRPDFNKDFPHKLYYGKVEGFGYVVAEDELEGGN